MTDPLIDLGLWVLAGATLYVAFRVLALWCKSGPPPDDHGE
jgi:hypothetical protein